jgi:hypothetical protein
MTCLARSVGGASIVSPHAVQPLLMLRPRDRRVLERQAGACNLRLPRFPRRWQYFLGECRAQSEKGPSRRHRPEVAEPSGQVELDYGPLAQLREIPRPETQGPRTRPLVQESAAGRLGRTPNPMECAARIIA